MNSASSSHFENKKAIDHVIEKRAEGILAFSEAHGTEIPGHLSAGADAAREAGLCLLLLWALAMHFSLPEPIVLTFLIGFGTAFTAWKAGRSAWLAWSRLERLHRIVEEEKYEIEHNREQEKQELTALYRAKGFEGKLLEDVIHVLMADGDRLLKLMLEEELGLSLETHEHPLKQSFGACCGAFLASLFIICSFIISPEVGILAASFATIAFGSAISAKYEKNRLLPSIVWNLSIAGLSFGFIYFISELISKKI